MSSSDDDMPPPLEDMTEQVNAAMARKQKLGAALGQPVRSAAAAQQQEEDYGEEIRLVPKKKPAAAAGSGQAGSGKGITRIAPTEDD